MMDAKETIGRAVAKVKGEEYHGAIKGEVFVCACGFQADAFRLWTRHEVDYVRDYTSEANIREAVRVLCDTEERRAEYTHRLVGRAWTKDPYDMAFKANTAPAEVLAQALLPRAQEILEECKVKDAKV